MKRSSIAFILAVIILFELCGCAHKTESNREVPTVAPTLTIDFSNKIGSLKPVNGINNGPKSDSTVSGKKIEWRLDTTEIYKELKIPYIRTHDMEYPDGSDYFIDIHCIFPDMSKEATDPTAYNFTGTDAYIANIRNCGAEVFYRLGESIAPSVSEITYQNPPKDYQKWAEVCQHIIAHYNDGWNNGFHYNIQYWEIWNEPDMPRQWSGDLNDYYVLYKTTARYLKSIYPDIKIGGGVLASAEEDAVRAFLDGINDDGKETPLDFYSWHLYTKEAFRYTYRANLVRRLLDEYGYNDAQTFADEWNYVDDWNDLESTWEKIYSSDIASFYAASLITLQKSAVDAAMYYDGTLTGKYAKWCGLYTSEGEILPGYYAFWAFNKLKDIGEQVEISSKRDPIESGVYTCATSGDTDAILLANTSDRIVRFRVYSNSDKKNGVKCFIVNRDNVLGTELSDQSFSDNETIELQPWEMRFIELY